MFTSVLGRYVASTVIYLQVHMVERAHTCVWCRSMRENVFV